MMAPTCEPLTSRADFPITHWSLILNSSGSSPASQAALEELCLSYWHPLYAFLRRRGATPHDAQDLVQGFLERWLERKDLATVSPDKGRFRTFLLTALRNFMIKQVEHDKARKRGGRAVLVPLDVDQAERNSLPDLSAESPEAACDRQWARTVLDRAVARLRAEQVARNKEALFERLIPFLEGADPNEYEAVGKSMGMRKGTVAVAVHRLRGRLRELLRAEVLQTVGNRADAESELRELMEALARS
jgi:RNA polymerase sigma-70 factor (ECF subfamily)